MIAVILPTRGLLFSKVLMALEEERKKYDIKIYCSDHLPIPDGHNTLTKQALEDGADFLWYVEEDTVPPARAIEKLLAVHADIACIDYGVSGWGCVTKNNQGEILWCGLGNVLIRREVFEAMQYPYFRVDKVLRLNDWTWQDLPEDYAKSKGYGGLDIWFFSEARRLGFKINQVEGEEAVHLQLDELGKRGINNGLHTISEKPKIEKRQILEEGKPI